MKDLTPSASVVPQEFSLRLEALRGVAALMVVGHHSFPPPFFAWMHIPFNGSAAVSLFFVLSGYVLGLSLRRGTGPLVSQYTTFVARRFLRIYPALLVTSFLFLLYWKVYPFAGIAGQLSYYPELKLSLWRVIKNLTFLEQSINGVTWSLKVEMVGSLLLPIFHFLTARWRWPARWAFLVFLFLIAFTPSSTTTRLRIYMFYLGYMLVSLDQLPRLSAVAYSRLSVICLTVLVGSYFWGANLRLGLLTEAFAAAGLILCIQAGGCSLGGLLDHPWSRFAGRVSFSLFLCHVVFLDVVLNLFWLSPLKSVGHLVFPWTSLLLSMPIILVASWALYSWVELPCMKLSKRLLPQRDARPTQPIENRIPS